MNHIDPCDAMWKRWYALSAEQQSKYARMYGSAFKAAYALFGNCI